MGIENITTEDFIKLYQENKENLEIIDVREADEYEAIHIINSKLIPMGDVFSRLSEINWDKKVIFVCRSGARSAYIGGIAGANNGKIILNLESGIIGLNSAKVDGILEK